jgi:serine/threonine protein kinase
VFKCKFIGVPAAAKVFNGTDTQLVKAVEAEAKIFASLQRPNVVWFIGYAIKGTQHCFLTHEHGLVQVLEGTRSCIGSPLSLLVAIDVMLQIARAMDYLHQKKVMHHDLKSKNVLMDIISNKNLALGRSSLHFNVTDFGLSKLQDRSTTLRVGSTPWMAPEVFGWTTWHTQTQLMCIVLQWFSLRSSLGRYHLLTYSGLTSIKTLK